MGDMLYSLLIQIQQNFLLAFGVLFVALAVSVVGFFMMRGQSIVERQRALFLVFSILGIVIVVSGFYGSLLLISLL